MGHTKPAAGPEAGDLSAPPEWATHVLLHARSHTWLRQGADGYYDAWGRLLYDRTWDAHLGLIDIQRLHRARLVLRARPRGRKR